MATTTKSKAAPNMVRIPSDLAGKLDVLAVRAGERLGVVGADELSRTFVHHLALRRGVQAMAADMGITDL